MNTFSPLWNGLVDSSIWEEPDSVFRVFMAMMSLKDADHVVRMDGYKLARRIHMDLKVVEEALGVLSEPDKRRPDQEYDGRRIERHTEGWLVLNGEKYRRMISEELRRARNRRNQAAWRDRQKKGSRGNGPLRGEVASLAAERRGDEAGARRILEESLPVPEVSPRGRSPVLDSRPPEDQGEGVSLGPRSEAEEP